MAVLNMSIRSEWLGIYWPADEYLFIKLTVEKKFDKFFAEAGELLKSLLSEPTWLLKGAITDAIVLNQALVVQPFVCDDIVVISKYNVLPFCDAVRRGVTLTLREEVSHVEINRSKSCFLESSGLVP